MGGTGGADTGAQQRWRCRWCELCARWEGWGRVGAFVVGGAITRRSVIDSPSSALALSRAPTVSDLKILKKPSTRVKTDVI